MSKYETAAGVPPVKIITIHTMRKRRKLGDAIEEPRLYEDFFLHTTRPGNRLP